MGELAPSAHNGGTLTLTKKLNFITLLRFYRSFLFSILTCLRQTSSNLQTTTYNRPPNPQWGNWTAPSAPNGGTLTLTEKLNFISLLRFYRSFLGSSLIVVDYAKIL